MIQTLIYEKFSVFYSLHYISQLLRNLFGDEASFPQRGSLSYTRAKKGHQPVVKTSGTRKAYRVFGLTDYFSGRFFCKAHEGRLNSDSYAAFLTEVVEKSDEHLILTRDGAGYHTGKVIHLERLTVQDLKSNEFYIICKMVSMTLVRLFQP